MANTRILRVFSLNRQQAGHWISLDYYILMNWTHVPVVVQHQTDGCSISSKDGAVVWQSFRQLATGCRTILEMAVDDCRCPLSLSFIGRSPWRGFAHHAFMLLLHCTFSPHFLAQQGVRRVAQWGGGGQILFPWHTWARSKGLRTIIRSKWPD